MPSAASAPARPSRGPLRALGSALGRGSGLLVVALAAIGFYAATPPSAGADEPTHQATAWYVTEHLLPPVVGAAWNEPADVVARVPASLVVEPCFTEEVGMDASCLPARTADAPLVETSSIGNYPPFYYWVVGLGQRVAGLAGLGYADLGGRAASLLLALGALVVLGRLLRRRHPDWESILLVLATPTAVFFMVVVNPSGWEIVAGICFAAVLAEALWVAPGFDRRRALGVGAACVVICLARPLGPIWAVGLAASALALAPGGPTRRRAVELAAVIAPGIALGLGWVATHPPRAGRPLPEYVPVPLTAMDVAAWFSISVDLVVERLRQVVGVLGWLDTSIPNVLFLALLCAWTVLVVRLGVLTRLAALCGIAWGLLVPSAIEALGSGSVPLYWQGRYTMPFLLGFAALLLLRADRTVPATARALAIVEALTVTALGAMVWVNAIRYAFPRFPVTAARLGPPAIDPLGLFVAYAVGYLLLSLAAVRFLRLVRSAPSRSAA